MNDQTLAPATKRVLLQLAELPLPDNFYLSGGTALALHLGHRESEDLDFFSQKDFDASRLQQLLEKSGKLESVELSDNTLNGYLDAVKIQFLGYPYPLREPVTEWSGINLSSILDIALTKLQTIGMRGSKKDFVDLYFILKKFTLEQLFAKLSEKYQDTDFNVPHILKSLVYFDDAELEPIPRMHKDITWNQIKGEIIQKATSFRI